MISLSKRMQRLCDFVSPGARICDVGCDHGFVSIYLVQADIAESALAMDVRPGPLSRAQENIKKMNVDTKVITRLSDGLHEYKSGEADTLIIAGMGGKLMARILEEGKMFWGDFQNVILEPQSDLPWFRHFLDDNGFEIEDEDIVMEDGKYYFFLRCKCVNPAENTQYSENEADFYVGKFNLAYKKRELFEYLNNALATTDNIIAKVSDSPKSAARDEKLAALKSERAIIMECLK